MVVVSMRDWTREESVAEDDAQDPEDAIDAPPKSGAEDDTDAGTAALAAPADDADEDGVPGIPGLRHRLSAISPSRPSRLPVPSAVAAATGLPAERKPIVWTRRVMLSPTEIAALGKYRMMTPKELATAPEWQCWNH